MKRALAIAAVLSVSPSFGCSRQAPQAAASAPVLPQAGPEGSAAGEEAAEARETWARRAPAARGLMGMPAGPAARFSGTRCATQEIGDVIGTPVWRLPGEAIGFRSGMRIDPRGAPMAYHAEDRKALDYLINADKHGEGKGLLEDHGKPIVQGRKDPAPGFFVSRTALVDATKPVRSPSRYVDASTVPYISIPPQARDWGADLGDFAVVLNTRNGRVAFAIVADLGPETRIGEGSPALADALGIASSPKDGGADSGVLYAIFGGSGNKAPRPVAEIERETKRLFDANGGRRWLATCVR